MRLETLSEGQVCRELVVRESSSDTQALIADLAIRGVWTPQTKALFDVRVIDTDTRSYQHQTPHADSAAWLMQKKKREKSIVQHVCLIHSTMCFSRWYAG